MKVLIALDESPISRRAASEAARLFPDAEFFVVNVSRVLVPWVAAGYGSVYPLPGTNLPLDGLSDDEVARRAAALGIEEPSVITVAGDPADMIVEASEAHDVDVVVVGSQDKGVLWGLVAPSVARAVTKGTHRPVLVVSGEPPPETS